jgi:hypothetical protein
MSTNKMMSVRSLFLRLNHDRIARKTTDILGRNDLWLTEAQLKLGTEKFIKLNGYQKIEFNRAFNHGGYRFTAPIVGLRDSSQDLLNEVVYQGQGKDHNRVENRDYQSMEAEQNASEVSEGDPSTITLTVCIINPIIQYYDLRFFGHLESVLHDIIDNYENTNLLLVTDSLSYISITTKEEISVTLESLMEEGLHLLFMNERADYAFFEKYEDITEKPITVYGD